MTAPTFESATNTFHPVSPTLLVDAKEAARLLCVCTRTLFDRTKAGALECVRIGSRVLYDRLELVAYIERLKQVTSHACIAGPLNGGVLLAITPSKRRLSGWKVSDPSKVDGSPFAPRTTITTLL